MEILAGTPTPTIGDLSQLLGGGGIWLPPGGLRNWRTARSQASGPGARLVTMLGWGDSVMQGFFSSSFKTKSWFGKLALDLQAAYGDGGSGYTSSADTPNWVAGSAGDVAAAGLGTGGNLTAQGGGGALQFLANGINGFSVGIAAAGGVGSTMTYPNVRGTTIDVYWVPLIATGMDFTYAIDGGAPVVVHTGGGSTGTFGKTTIAGLAPGNHTVVITYTTNSAYVCGVAGRNAAGLVAHRMALSGRSTDKYTSLTSGFNAANTDGFISINPFVPDLFIFSLGGNDATTSKTADSVSLNTRRALDAARAANPLCDVVIVNNHIGTLADPTPLYHEYGVRLQALAQAYGAAYVDLWNVGRNSWNYWNGLGYWGDGTADGLAGTNTVHLSDAGHAYVESVMKGLLTL